ncbi:MAG TPA: STAS domain-containing protein [Ignavibacteriaceae bacterium]|nr:STAS domain-containing protein [Ignavibacteriaceae bacterium]
MDIHAEHNNDNSLIIVDKNKLIGIESETLQNLVQESIDKGSKNVSIDLSKVEYVSSWGVGIIVHAYTTCHNKNVNFNLKGVNPHVMNVLSQLKLTEVLNIN